MISMASISSIMYGSSTPDMKMSRWLGAGRAREMSPKSRLLTFAGGK